MNELDIPEEVFEAESAHEMLRFWIVDGEDAVTLHVGAMGEDEPTAWGWVLADLARHAVNAMTQRDPSLDAETVRAQLEAGFDERMGQRVGVSGSIRGRKQ